MSQTPRLIVHGGAGRALRDPERADAVRAALAQVRDELVAALADGVSAREVVVLGCRRLEDAPTFNAGTGSVLQSDGQVRMSAALMDAAPDRPRFSGVVNARRVQNPVELADALQGARDRVLDGQGAAELARALGVPVFDPVVPRRLREWLREREESFEADMADVTAHERGHGTVGVVAQDASGALAAATSTGGRGFEHIGRVSDSATPAGNYATQAAGVSCTGIGEDILDACLAARLVVRAEDGQPLHEVMARSMRESQAQSHQLAAIAIDASGVIAWGKTTDILLASWHDGQRAGDTLSLPEGLQCGHLPPG